MSESSRISLPSFAKINWFLQIIGKRPDNFHEICTLFQTVSLKDEITFARHPDELCINSNDIRLAADPNNLILRAGNLLRQKFGVTEGAKIYLEKWIPYPGGLGGGSSNAAVALLGLSLLWKLEISAKELLLLAAELGADVSFFLYGGSMLGTGRGETLEFCDEISEEYIVVVTPDIEVSTAKAYRDFAAPRLTKNSAKSILRNCRFSAESLLLGQSNVNNDFERSVFCAHPEIEIIKNQLIEMGGKCSLLSGSGASVFGVFDNFDEQKAAMAFFSKVPKLRRFAVKTVSTREYREAFAPCLNLLPDDS